MLVYTIVVRFQSIQWEVHRCFKQIRQLHSHCLEAIGESTTTHSMPQLPPKFKNPSLKVTSQSLLLTIETDIGFIWPTHLSVRTGFEQGQSVDDILLRESCGDWTSGVPQPTLSRVLWLYRSVWRLYGRLCNVTTRGSSASVRMVGLRCFDSGGSDVYILAANGKHRHTVDAAHSITIRVQGAPIGVWDMERTVHCLDDWIQETKLSNHGNRHLFFFTWTSNSNDNRRFQQRPYSSKFYYQEAIKEIYETERDFVHSVNTAIEVWIQRGDNTSLTSSDNKIQVFLKPLQQAVPPILSQDEINAIFCNLEDILEAHVKVSRRFTFSVFIRPIITVLWTGVGQTEWVRTGFGVCWSIHGNRWRDSAASWGIIIDWTNLIINTDITTLT